MSIHLGKNKTFKFFDKLIYISQDGLTIIEKELKFSINTLLIQYAVF